MAKPKRLTKEQIVQIAKSNHMFLCHRYSWSKDYLRETCRKMAKQKTLFLVGYTKEDKVYIPIDDKFEKRIENAIGFINVSKNGRVCTHIKGQLYDNAKS